MTRKTVLLVFALILLGTGMAVAVIPQPHTARPAAERDALSKPVPQKDTRTQAIKASYLKIPLSFIKNEGQKDKAILFYEQGNGHATAFTKEGISLTLSKSGKTKARSSELLTLTPLNASSFTIEALDRKEGKVNYFIGKDPSKWKAHIPTYGAILYKGVYPGIDMKFYGTNSHIEYDIIVAPHADPARVRLSYKGAEKLSVTPRGELEITLTNGSIFQKKPFIYQTIEDKKTEIRGRFVLLDKTTYAFEVGPYDRSIPLIIDPTLVYSTYLGGTGEDYGNGIAVDSSGNVYVAGHTTSTDFPTASAFQGANGGGYCDAFVTRLNPSGSLVFSTYLGGEGNDWANGIAVDSSGSVYVSGTTNSDDFPTANAFQGSKAGSTNTFITKLAPSGAGLTYSTYLGGNGTDYGFAMAIDSSGNVYVAGSTSSTNFPTVNARQGTYGGSTDAFVAKLNSSGASLAYSTYLGGSGTDYGYSIAVDSSGNAYVTGNTASADFPIAGAYQGTYAGGATDAFVAKLSASGSSLAYSTYLGGSGDDSGYSIAVDSSGSAYVAGYTASSGFPTVNAYQGSRKGSTDAFVTKFNSSGSALTYSTYLGGTGNDYAFAIAVDPAGNAYVTGNTYCADFPTVNAHQLSIAGQNDAFVTKFNSSGSALTYSTYLGGSGLDYGRAIAVDAWGNGCVAGYTLSTNFPTVNAGQGSYAGNTDAFVARFSGSTAVYPYFSGDGLYKYDGSFTKITVGQPQMMISAGLTMYFYFSGDGLYKYNGSWTKITSAQPQTMVAAGSTMYFYFPGDGLYKYDGSWSRITAGQPQTMVAAGSTVYLNFPGDGLYKYDGSSWTLLTRTGPQSIVASSEGFYAWFASDGLYRYNGSWTKITSAQPATMVVSGSTLYPFFTGDGLYKYDGSSWTLLTRTGPQSIVASSEGFYAWFASDGLYRYNGSWTKITASQSVSMVVSGSALYPYFSGDGLYKYDGSWTFLTRAQPASMTGFGPH